MRTAARRGRWVDGGWRGAAALIVLGAVLAIAVPAAAISYWTVPQVLKSFFASSKRVGHKRVTLARETTAAIAKAIGAPSVPSEWLVYVGEKDGKRTGYAVIDAEKGMHELIDFAVRFDDAGTVQRVEVLAYREAYGDEIRAERFRAQFRGKTAADAIVAGKDIDIISGATISAHSLARGVKRDTLVLRAALKSGAL